MASDFRSVNFRRDPHTHTDPLVADRCHRCLSIDEQFEAFLGITCLESSFQ